MLSALQLQRCAIYTRASRCTEILPHLNASLTEAQVDTALRLAMYVAQLEHETDHFRTMEEYANGAAYDLTVNPRLAARLGNVEPGDGPAVQGPRRDPTHRAQQLRQGGHGTQPAAAR
jgi:hypothetical protein